MCESVRRGDFVVTLHAADEMTADHLMVFDVENAILTGEIVERQRDLDTGEWKYVVRGPDLNGLPLCIVAKLSWRNALIIITAYRSSSTNGRRR